MNSQDNQQLTGRMDDPYTVGEQMLERAKRIAQKIDQRVRQITDQFETSSAAATPSDAA